MVNSADDLAGLLQRQKAARVTEGPVSAVVRRDRLQRAIDMLDSRQLGSGQRLVGIPSLGRNESGFHTVILAEKHS